MQAWGRATLKGYRRDSVYGFTLIELLVVLVVAAVLVSIVSVSGTPSPQRTLRFDAERLALILALAREESQVRGRPIRWVSSERGYRFEIFSEQAWRIVDDDQALRARDFTADTVVRVERADAQKAGVEFGRDWIEAPFTVVLQRAGAQIVIAANGLGDFSVRE